MKDRNIQIGFTVDKVKNTISIKESVLDLFSLTVTHHQKKYAENKKSINKTIKDIIGKPGAKDIAGLSSRVSQFLLSVVSVELEDARKRDLKLSRDDIQTIANTLFEFIENNKEYITRNEELTKITKIYKKLYASI